MVELKKSRINSTIDSDLEQKFREIAFKKYGYKKGSIQEGLEDAISSWLQNQSKKKGEKK